MPAEGRVAVKISTGEAGNNNHLKAELIGPLVKLVNGKIVECNTAYAGQRMNTEDHLKVIEAHGFNTIGGVDIMDADGEIKNPCATPPTCTTTSWARTSRTTTS